MSKYGNSVSMRTVIESEVNEVNGILEKSSLSKKQKEQVVDAMKEMAYQWCCANASACALENAIREICPKEMERIMFASIRSGFIERKKAETYPY